MPKNNLSKSIQKNIKMLKTMFFVCGLFFYGNFASAAALNLPKDSEGWTIFTPSDDSRIMYVSADGDDSTGTIYDNNDAALGGNPFNPAGPINSFATYAAAYANTRDGYPDWVLFKRGDTFDQVLGESLRNGRSSSEPSLVGAYGASGPSPILNVTTASGIDLRNNTNKQFLAIVGLSFYSPTRDPGNVNYTGISGHLGFHIVVGPDRFMDNILFEGCRFSYMTNNVMQGPTQIEKAITNVGIRRCVFLSNYSNGSGHSQGLFLAHADNVVIEESIFDHNGWYSQAGSGGVGQATMFNHNTYTPDMRNFSVSKNVFMRPSSIQNKFTADWGAASATNITIDNNFYIDGEIGISIGGNSEDPYRYKDVLISDNVVTSMNLSRPTNRDLATSFDVQDWDGGNISGNYVINSNMGVSIGFRLRGTLRNVNIDNNTIYNFRNLLGGLGLNNDLGSNVENMSFTNNNIQNPELSGYTIISEYDPVGKWTFSGNKYYSNRSDGTRFWMSGINLTDVQWREASGDNFAFEQIIFPDPTRSVETYMASVGEISTLESFYEKCRAQDRYNWNSKFTAEPVNAYIKAGFATATFRADVDGSSGITTTDALLTLRNSLGLSMAGTAWQASATTGDVNCDGVANSTDALLILRQSLGLNMSETGWCE